MASKKQKPLAKDTEHSILSRLTFGSEATSRVEIGRLGLTAWLAQQLRPDETLDGECQTRLKNLKLRIRYPESKDWAAVDEMRPLHWLGANIEELSRLNEPGRQIAHAEKTRPRVEVAAATLMRAVYSRWQLREVLADFWHNHFNVNGWDVPIGLALPVYDREVIRFHAFGNFREMLEAVAQSPAMLWYLNNRSSRAGAPNENYARELFELHTLGRDAYLNGIYNRWKDVPGAKKGQPAGYIDQDVYEAARAFTGWGVEDGSGLGGGQSLSRSGRFIYVDAWHDQYQKRVLATEFEPYQSALSDGRKVLDLAAFHPATARHLAKKLCIRLLCDEPPPALIDSAAKVWYEHRFKPDQIARTIEHIVLAKAFASEPNAKLKRPLELVASFVRASELPFVPTEGLLGEMETAGQRLFGWATPTGHPDQALFWSGANTMRRRWTLIAGLVENWWGNGVLDPLHPFGSKSTMPENFARVWLERLYGRTAPAIAGILIEGAKAGGQPSLRPVQARQMLAWAAMAPAFQLR